MFVSDSDFQRADWPLLQNGAVNLFLKPEILAEACEALSVLDYEIAEVSCAGSALNFEAEISRVLRWQEAFGYETWNGNLNALNDGFGCYPFGPSSRSALVLDRISPPRCRRRDARACDPGHHRELVSQPFAARQLPHRLDTDR